MKVIIIGKIFLLKSDIEKIKSVASIVFHEQQIKNDDDFIQVIGDADIVVSALVPYSEKVLSSISAKNVKLISLATTGFDDIDLNLAKKYALTVCYTPGYATEAVAEQTIGLMLAASRFILKASLDLHNGIFEHSRYQGKQLLNKTLGIIGKGRIGSRVGEIASAIGMKLIYFDKDSTQADLENLLRISDVISLHLPLTARTENFISNKQFSLMKEGVIIVNTARGELIDEDALIENLKSGKIFAAGIDVFKDFSKKELFSLPNLIITPHIAYNTEEALIQRSNIVSENIKKFVEKFPQNAVCIP